MPKRRRNRLADEPSRPLMAARLAYGLTGIGRRIAHASLTLQAAVEAAHADQKAPGRKKTGDGGEKAGGETKAAGDAKGRRPGDARRGHEGRRGADRRARRGGQPVRRRRGNRGPGDRRITAQPAAAGRHAPAAGVADRHLRSAQPAHDDGRRGQPERPGPPPARTPPRRSGTPGHHQRPGPRRPRAGQGGQPRPGGRAHAGRRPRHRPDRRPGRRSRHSGGRRSRTAAGTGHTAGPGPAPDDTDTVLLGATDEFTDALDTAADLLRRRLNGS